MLRAVMIDVAGFCGLTYDPATVELSRVITPPYDVIDPAQRVALADRSPYNFVGIDLPESAAPGADRYRGAADRLASYRANGILRQDRSPTLYRYHQEFVDRETDRTVIRKGVIAAVALSPWSTGAIRPHETTFRAPVEDRARLLEATRVHLSPVFAMYDGDAHAVDQLLARACATPDLVARTDDGTRHSVWRISDAGTIAEVSRVLAPHCAYVLDGHHRYETMVAFHDRDTPSAVSRGLMFLVPMSDPGLIVLPTHRLVDGVHGLTRDRFLADVGRLARIEPIRGAARDPGELRRVLASASDGAVFAAVFPGDPDAHLLTVSGDGRSAVSEISVLHDSILAPVLGIVSRPGASDARLRYVSDTAAALDAVAAGRAQLALLVRPPRLSQIKQVADRGQVMPQKSTYLFPKLASGLVMMAVDA
jgi:uncharacterized protein (DUF1015 family)